MFSFTKCKSCFYRLISQASDEQGLEFRCTILREIKALVLECLSSTKLDAKFEYLTKIRLQLRKNLLVCCVGSFFEQMHMGIPFATNKLLSLPILP